MKKTKKGFTLVELVIVIAVIAILAAVLIPTFAGIIERSRESARIQQVTSARDEFYTSNEKMTSTDQLEGLVFVIDNHVYVVKNGQIVNAGGDITLQDIESDYQTYEGYDISNENIVIYKLAEEGPITISYTPHIVVDGDEIEWENAVGTYIYVNAEGDTITGYNNSYELTEIYVPLTITKIGEEAFYSCSTLSVVALPDSVTVIDDYAFEYCCLTQFNIPKKIERIGNSAFDECLAYPFERWTNYVLPDTLTEVGSCAFSYNDCIEGILTLPNNLTTVEYCAFGYFSLSGVVIPASLTEIESEGFLNFRGDGVVYYKGTPEQYALITIGSSNQNFKNALVYYYTDNPDITADGYYWYYDSNKEIVTIDNDSNYDDIYLQFTYDENGGAVVVGYAGTDTTVTIPDRVSDVKSTFIKDEVFTTKTAMTDFASCLYEKYYEGAITIKYGADLTSPDATLNFADGDEYTYWLNNNSVADNGSKQWSVSYTANVYKADGKHVIRKIGSSAFKGNKNITSVVFNNSIYAIESYAFYGSGLTSVTLADPISQVYGYAFAYSDIASVTVTTSNSGNMFKEKGTFQGCVNLTDISSIPSLKADEMFKDCTGLVGAITLNSSNGQLGSRLFSGCVNITSITIPNNTRSVGKNLVEGCTSLTDIIFTNTSGWGTSNNPMGSKITNVDVSNSQNNVTLLQSTYPNYFLRR